MDDTWFFRPQRVWVKALRFLNILEDETVKLSWTGLNNAVAVVNNIHALAFTHDVIQTGAALGHGVIALFFHSQKRAQLLKVGKGVGLPE